MEFLSISSHKIYGPKGVGALYVADDELLLPMSTGGGQERGLRSGTVPTELSVRIREGGGSRRGRAAGRC